MCLSKPGELKWEELIPNVQEECSEQKKSTTQKIIASASKNRPSGAVSELELNWSQMASEVHCVLLQQQQCLRHT